MVALLALPAGAGAQDAAGVHEAAPAVADGRLELRTGLVVRDDAVRAGGERIDAHGSALAPLATVRAHGPAVAARIDWAALPWLGLEAGGRALPLSSGARYGGAELGLRRWGGGAALRLGRAVAAGLRLSALVAYDFTATTGSADRVDLRQHQHSFGVGVRTDFLRRPPVVSAAPIPAPAVVVATRRLRGVVRAGGASPQDPPGAPVAHAEVSSAGGALVRTDAAGRFALEGLAEGPIELHLA